MSRDGETRSNAALRSTNTTTLTWPLPAAFTHLSYIVSRAVMVDLPPLYPCSEG